MKNRIHIIVSALLLLFTLEPVSAREISNQCSDVKRSFENSYQTILLELEDVRNELFSLMGNDFSGDFNSMKNLGCSTNLNESTVYDMLDSFESKYQTNVSNIKVPGWDIKIDAAPSVNTTVERTEAFKTAFKNGDDLPIWSAGITVVRISKEYTGSEGQNIKVTQLLDPCVEERLYLNISNLPEHLSKNVESSGGQRYPYTSISIEKEWDLNKLLPLDCDGDDQSFGFREMMGFAGWPMSDIESLLQIFK